MDCFMAELIFWKPGIGMCYSGGIRLVVGFILFKIVDLIHPMRVSIEAEELGLDITQHDEKL